MQGGLPGKGKSSGRVALDLTGSNTSSDNAINNTQVSTTNEKPILEDLKDFNEIRNLNKILNGRK